MRLEQWETWGMWGQPSGWPGLSWSTQSLHCSQVGLNRIIEKLCGLLSSHFMSSVYALFRKICRLLLCSPWGKTNLLSCKNGLDIENDYWTHIIQTLMQYPINTLQWVFYLYSIMGCKIAVSMPQITCAPSRSFTCLLLMHGNWNLVFAISMHSQVCFDINFWQSLL